MSTSQMLNFRVKAEFLTALDKACKASGMSRSNFIRTALQQAVTRALGTPAPDPVDSKPRVRPVAAKKSVASSGAADCANGSHPKDKIKLLPQGTKLCTACNRSWG